jgi:tripartite-type tricarboxylate transporter receptor subunit TctC
VVPQNSAGAGGLKLINQLYNVSPKDGTVIGLVNRGIPLEPLVGGEGTQFDPLRMNWIGSPDNDTTVCVARTDAKVRSIQDLFANELLMGATGSGADTAVYPEFLSQLLGMKFKVIKGYQGTKEISLAMERKEVEGICVAYDSLRREPLAREGKINILFQAALKPDPRLKNVPVGTDLARSEEDRQVLRLFFTRVALGRPFVAPPGVPATRIALLRQAFDETMRDPAFLEDARRQELNVNVTTGGELSDIIVSAYSTPENVVMRMAKALGRPGRNQRGN